MKLRETLTFDISTLRWFAQTTSATFAVNAVLYQQDIVTVFTIQRHSIAMYGLLP